MIAQMLQLIIIVTLVKKGETFISKAGGGIPMGSLSASVTANNCSLPYTHLLLHPSTQEPTRPPLESGLALGLVPIKRMWWE